jgi:hypothetical protein
MRVSARSCARSQCLSARERTVKAHNVQCSNGKRSGAIAGVPHPQTPCQRDLNHVIIYQLTHESLINQSEHKLRSPLDEQLGMAPGMIPCGAGVWSSVQFWRLPYKYGKI